MAYIVAKNLFFNFYKKKKREKRLFEEVASTINEDYNEEKEIYDIEGVTDIDKQIIFYNITKSILIMRLLKCFLLIQIQ